MTPKHRCPGGNACFLTHGMQHELCICNDPRCICHSRERYDYEREQKPEEAQREIQRV